MTNASIPSTLVKCLYLFFDLPELGDEDENSKKSKFTNRERRILLQKLFVQVRLQPNLFFKYTYDELLADRMRIIIKKIRQTPLVILGISTFVLTSIPGRWTSSNGRFIAVVFCHHISMPTVQRYMEKIGIRSSDNPVTSWVDKSSSGLLA